MQRIRETATRRAFTVIELMVVISIIALLAAMAASALSNAAEQARAQRTRAIVNKIDQLIMEKWDSYRTRAVPYAQGAHPRASASNRLNAMRELQRLELPDRKTDLVNDDTGNTMETAAYSQAVPSVARGYFRKANSWTGGNLNNWDTANQGAECLYLILSSMRDGDKSALEFFTPSEIGDVDGDGMPEILDAWGNPITFIRWPAGYTRESAVGPLTSQTSDHTLAPDPFDPIKIDTRNTYALKPLILSAGPNGSYDITMSVDVSGNPLRYSKTTPPNDPYIDDSAILVGSVGDSDDDGVNTGWTDNITNHYFGEP